MKKVKSILIRTAIILAFAAFMTSCMTTKTSVGAYKESSGSTYTYGKGRQLWLFWGIFPLGRVSVNTPGDGNCQVVTSYEFVDFVISGLTGGILTSYSIKVKAKK